MTPVCSYDYLFVQVADCTFYSLLDGYLRRTVHWDYKFERRTSGNLGLVVLGIPESQSLGNSELFSHSVGAAKEKSSVGTSAQTTIL